MDPCKCFVALYVFNVNKFHCFMNLILFLTFSLCTIFLRYMILRLLCMYLVGDFPRLYSILSVFHLVLNNDLTDTSDADNSWLLQTLQEFTPGFKFST